MNADNLMDHTQGAKDYIAGCIGGKVIFCDKQVNDCPRFENARFTFVKLLRLLKMVTFEGCAPSYKTSSGTLMFIVSMCKDTMLPVYTFHLH